MGVVINSNESNNSFNSFLSFVDKDDALKLCDHINHCFRAEGFVSLASVMCKVDEISNGSLNGTYPTICHLTGWMYPGVAATVKKGDLGKYGSIYYVDIPKLPEKGAES